MICFYDKIATIKNLFLVLLILFSLFANIVNAQKSAVNNQHCANEEMMQHTMDEEMQNCVTCLSSVFLQNNMTVFSYIILSFVIINHQKTTDYNSLTLKVTTPPPTV